MSNICTPYYDNQYLVFARQSGAVNTNVAIRHPNVFYFVLDASWSSSNSLEYWNKGNTATNLNNNTVYKTIYSPSPTDYAEPLTSAYTGFTTTGGWTNNISLFNSTGQFNKGRNFYCQLNFSGGTIFFSALGYRDTYSGNVNVNNAGILNSIPYGGYYWVAGPSTSSTKGRVLDFNSTNTNPCYENFRGYGFTSRSVLQ